MAWLPAGPTASKAAEIIPLLVVVPFLFSFSFMCVVLLSSCCVCPLSHAHRIGLQFLTNTHTLIKGQPRYCVTATQEEQLRQLSKIQDFGFACTTTAALLSAAACMERKWAPYRCEVTSMRKSRPARTCSHRHADCKKKGSQPSTKSTKDTTATSLHTRTTSGPDHSSLHHTAISSLESQQMEMLHAKADVLATVCRPTETDTGPLERRNKSTTYAEAWNHDVAIAGLQYDLLVLSSSQIVRIIKHVVRS